MDRMMERKRANDAEAERLFNLIRQGYLSCESFASKLLEIRDAEYHRGYAAGLPPLPRTKR